MSSYFLFYFTLLYLFIWGAGLRSLWANLIFNGYLVFANFDEFLSMCWGEFLLSGGVNKKNCEKNLVLLSRFAVGQNYDSLAWKETVF